MKNLKILTLLGCICILTSCQHLDEFSGSGHASLPPTIVLEENVPYELPYEVISTIEDSVEIRNGGYGSAATAHPLKKGEFYAITDRGPNTDFLDGKKFPVASYTPRIGHFAVTETGEIIRVNDILLKDPNGRLITGLPNPEGKGATGEIPYDIEEQRLPFDDFGLDSEGLVALRDGSFWVSDEYGPHLVHYSADGVQLERISPYGVNDGNGGRKLPAVFAKRRPNRGMEGLAITPSERMLVGIMQSTLYNPDRIRTDLTRIVTFDLRTGKTKQYLYRQENNNLSNSEIVAITNTKFIVVERDGKFSGEGPAQKHIYEIDIKDATDISGHDVEAAFGMLIGGKTIEQSTWAEIEAAGIQAVSKKLIVDLVAETGYPHDKLEGIWLINRKTIACLNDDDFAVTDEDDNGIIEQKTLPGSSPKIDASSLYMIKLDQVLGH
ncbi:esterase-like activity of phytase family protein [Aquimarina sp. RZ0]|uniref:esterase-like activity of phytase family protein n=1 Tax=Aquimarina sp. RZ0 TaxID=2607730 RepID=UPI0011F37FAA|nr:esterase-like activity of phytase family protein [Aquimarina sp. RZ0]KAA1245060.1 esterase-like activity of phytase family protein [Aquimarina sp. RZ0]